MFAYFILVLIVGLALWFLLKAKKREGNAVLKATPAKWITFLENNVTFYRSLDEPSKQRFEHDLKSFLSEVRITSVDTEVALEDRLLVASSAVIPLFGFPHWHYSFLDEVILYPQAFDRNYNYQNPNEIITGMVGSGVMEGKMILSKPALHAGFRNDRDKKNVGIHEFVHLFDKEDGLIDGIAPGMERLTSSLPWLDLIRTKTRDILNSKSNIDLYAATNPQEFFAVASEYFFERPAMLKNKHPELYGVLSEVFNQDLASQSQSYAKAENSQLGRNSPCPCGSGKKYKRCCLE